MYIKSFLLAAMLLFSQAIVHVATAQTTVAPGSNRRVDSAVASTDTPTSDAPQATTTDPQRGLGKLISTPLGADVLQSAELDPAHSAGLFVGVSEFLDDGKPSTSISPIPYAVDDAIDLAWMFGFHLKLIAPQNVVISLSGKPVKAESTQRLQELQQAGAQLIPATAIGIQTNALNLSSKTGKNGILVLSIATHGFTERGDWLLAQDSNLALLQGTSIPLTTLEDIAARAEAPRRLVFIDACRERVSPSRSMADPDKALSEGFQKAFASATGTAVLMGTTLGGFSFDDPARQNGVFTCAILDGLRGMAPPDERGLITVAGLRDYTDSVVRDWVKKNRPELSGRSTGISAKLDDIRAATLPLAINPNATQLFMEQRQRIEAALAVLMDVGKQHPELITGALVDDVRRNLGRIDGSNRERVLVRLERLRTADDMDVEMFAGWWLTYSKQLDGAKSVEGQVVEPVDMAGAVPKTTDNPATQAGPYRTIIKVDLGYQLELEPIKIEAGSKRVEAEMKGSVLVLKNLGISLDDMALTTSGGIWVLCKRPLDGGFGVVDDAYDNYMDVVAQYIQPVNPDVKHPSKAWCRTYEVSNDLQEVSYQRILFSENIQGSFGVPNLEIIGARLVINRHESNSRATAKYGEKEILAVSYGTATASIKELMKPGRQQFTTTTFYKEYQDAYFEILFMTGPGQFQLMDAGRRSIGKVMPNASKVSQLQLPWLTQ